MIVLLVLLLAGAGYVVYAKTDMSNVGQLAFRNELQIPPLLEPTADSAGRKVFERAVPASTGSRSADGSAAARCGAGPRCA